MNPRPTADGGHSRRRSTAPLTALVALLLLLTGCASSNPGGKRPDADPIVWQAFYLPSSTSLLVHAAGGPCQATISATSDPGGITITAVPAPARPGAGSCEAPITGTLIHLQEPVGHRPIRAAPGSTGTSYDLSTRLHQPVTSSGGLPFGGKVIPTPTGDQWTLAYARGGLATPYVLMSAPDDRQHHNLPATVRHQPTISPCSAILCWRENGLLYSINPLGAPVDTTLTHDQALTLAATLT